MVFSLFLFLSVLRNVIFTSKVRWVRAFYDDFHKFIDQEQLISMADTVDYVEGFNGGLVGEESVWDLHVDICEGVGNKCD